MKDCRMSILETIQANKIVTNHYLLFKSGFSRYEIVKAIKELRSEGKIISVGAGAYSIKPS